MTNTSKVGRSDILLAINNAYDHRLGMSTNNYHDEIRAEKKAYLEAVKDVYRRADATGELENFLRDPGGTDTIALIHEVLGELKLLKGKSVDEVYLIDGVDEFAVLDEFAECYHRELVKKMINALQTFQSPKNDKIAQPHVKMGMDELYAEFYECPACFNKGNAYGLLTVMKYCPMCGVKLDWSKVI